MQQFLYNPYTLLILLVLGIVAGSAWRLWRNKHRGGDGNNSIQVNVSPVVVLVVVLSWLFQLPSLSIDINGIFTYAFSVVNAFMPLIAIIAGLGLGFNLIGKISGLFNRAL